MLCDNVANRGVVLYGMTIGRLPFLCPRDEWTSSEERRRRLMIQINRGLTSIQEKAMYQTSIECRNLINRLLVPSARERITIREILDHPWIFASSKSNFHLRSEDDLNVSNHVMVIYARCSRIFDHNHGIWRRICIENTTNIVLHDFFISYFIFFYFILEESFSSNFDIFQ